MAAGSARRLGALLSHVSAPCAAPAGAMAAPTMYLNTGQAMPILGLGTFEATQPGEIKRALRAAVKAGYRLIDCAANYGNQKEVGETLSELFAEGVVKREELFIVSKLFQTHHAWDGDDSRCREALATTLEDLQLDYLDLYLMHWPFAFGNKKLEMPPGTPQPLRELGPSLGHQSVLSASRVRVRITTRSAGMQDGSPNPIWTIKMEYLRTWEAMEGFVASGKVKGIGVSNFTQENLQHLIGVRPETHRFQFVCHTTCVL